MVGMSGAYGGSYNGVGVGESKPAAEVPVLHKVAAQPAQSTASKMKEKVKETFFPDDPFRSFKGQPLSAKWLMAVKYLFPILEWVPGYSFSLFKSDLVAGLTIASLAIPQASPQNQILLLALAVNLQLVRSTISLPVS